MALHAVFGFAPLLPKLLSGVLGALTAVVLYELGRRTFGQRAGLLAAAGAAVIPSLVIWSSLSLKEPLVLFVAVLGLWTLQRIVHLPASSARLGDALLLMLAIMAVSLDLRSTLSLILLGLVALVLLARSRFRPHPWQIGLAALGLLVLGGSGLWLARSRISDRPLGGVVEDVVLQIRHRRAQEAASARSQIRPELEVVTPTGSELPQAEAASDASPFTFTGDVVEPLAFSLLAPAPWQARSPLELGAAAEMLVVWYPLLVLALLARPANAGQRLFLACLIIYAFANWLVLAASEGNLGNLVRHRLMLVPTLLLLGAAGLDQLSKSRRWRRRGQGSAPRRARLLELTPSASAIEVQVES
jgi:4-amino-4-deoxy-L-arabinose transferase-like glycosyltransferase